MGLEKVTFQNKNGEDLIGRLQFPDEQHAKAYAIFAHCFTCGKNLKVIREISTALTKLGIAVLRFDFTGLGQSDGDFEETNFSHDIEDLIEASNFLKQNYEAPKLIIGHSLGGTAALFASQKIDSLKAIVSIASPSQPSHVEELIVRSTKEGSAGDDSNSVEISLGGKDFTIKKQFLDDIKSKDTASFLGDLKIPYLIMHSPQDRIVSIDNAEDLYKWSHHPKSFISLDKADHLLNTNVDASYIGSLIGHWSSNSLELTKDKNTAMESESQSAAVLNNEDKFTTQMKVGDFEMIGDEPESYGGHNFGPAPYDFLTAGLAECTAMTLHVYARQKKWALKEVKVHVDYEKKKIEDEDGKAIKKDFISKKIEILGDLDEDQKKRLVEIGERCPVNRTLHSEIEISSELIN
ncbi:bifunctional alpha/beta hydrolase/OsmC family protein [Psychroflexus tropicus]|uniref:bifunctional alpha/beta hydrolase/OsmC family protein n=1 Tax=Psychroflexus tropicus TaxID=197345 RepID=UPI000361DA79|nr:bifunctional alpha/beta hydrolase/OsmC family protein [Psychroflexus tropicus]